MDGWFFCDDKLADVSGSLETLQVAVIQVFHVELAILVKRAGRIHKARRQSINPVTHGLGTANVSKLRNLCYRHCITGDKYCHRVDGGIDFCSQSQESGTNDCYDQSDDGGDSN